jgi:hypothetical protein
VQVFDQAAAAGHANMHLLDIGGGFTGHFDAHGHVQFGDIARTINTALVAHFPSDCGVRVISEPGRYFAETSAALFTPVYGVRDRPPAQASPRTPAAAPSPPNNNTPGPLAPGTLHPCTAAATLAPSPQPRAGTGNQCRRRPHHTRPADTPAGRWRRAQGLLAD